MHNGLNEEEKISSVNGLIQICQNQLILLEHCHKMDYRNKTTFFSILISFLLTLTLLSLPSLSLFSFPISLMMRQHCIQYTFFSTVKRTAKEWKERITILLYFWIKFHDSNANANTKLIWFREKKERKREIVIWKFFFFLLL